MEESGLPARKRNLFSVHQNENKASVLVELWFFHVTQVDNTASAGATRTFSGQFCSTTCRLAHKNNVSHEEQLKTDADKRTWGAEDTLRREGAPSNRQLNPQQFRAFSARGPLNLTELIFFAPGIPPARYVP